MKQTSLIPIFFSSDDRYLPFLAVSIRSLIENADPRERYAVYILNTGLDPARVAPILAWERENVSITLTDVSREIAPLARRLHLRDYYTVSIYYRLFIASLFPQYKRAIYLDADIAVNGDIARLYRTPLRGNLLGAVSDAVIAGSPDFRRYAEEGLGIPYERYFNSGVLLLDLEGFRRENIEGQFVHLLREYHFDTVCPDQDYLNVLCRDRVLYLDEGWNKMSVNENYPGVPNLVHYNMFYKPWLYHDIPYSAYFWKYAAMTPFYGELCEILASFGEAGRREHEKADAVLHRRTREIAASPFNFNRALNIAEVRREPICEEVMLREAYC